MRPSQVIPSKRMTWLVLTFLNYHLFLLKLDTCGSDSLHGPAAANDHQVEMYPLPVLEARSPKSTRRQSSCSFSEGSRGKSYLTSSSLRGCLQTDILRACGCLPQSPLPLPSLQGLLTCCPSPTSPPSPTPVGTSLS